MLEQWAEQTLAMIDSANAEDPNTDVDYDGSRVPKELLYSQRMTDMLARFAPEADSVMAVAVRAQHIRRWTVPRSQYPMDKVGYHQWRTGLYNYHSELAANIAQEAGADAASVARILSAVGKRGIKSNEDSQLLEDVAGLVFIEHYMADFAAQKPDYTEEKWIGIIQKTWRKMSERAHAFALGGGIRLPQPLLPLIQKSIAS